MGLRVELSLSCLVLAACEAAALPSVSVRGQTPIAAAHASQLVPRAELSELSELSELAELAGLAEQTEQLDMHELSVVDAPLEPAIDEVAPFWPDWRLSPAPAGTLPRWIRHETVAGDTIEALALRYDVRADKIREWNEMAADEQPRAWRPEPLKIHARRYPPPLELLEHEVVEGDTWGTLSRRYGVDYRRLRSWNVRELGRSLELGERVKIWIDPLVFDAIVHDAPASARAAVVRPGAHSVGTPQAGALVAGVQIPPGQGYELRYPKSAYGTTFAVRQTIAALDHFAATSDYPFPISIGTMSRQRGGEIGDHLSHQSGRDLDIRLPLRAEIPQGLGSTRKRIDWLSSWALVQAFASAAEVQVIFLDYGSQRRMYRAAKDAGASEEELDALLQFPSGSGASRGLVRHSPGHEHHIHVRFPCGPAEPECSN